MKPNAKIPIYITQDGLDDLTRRRDAGDIDALSAFVSFSFTVYDPKELDEASVDRK